MSKEKIFSEKNIILTHSKIIDLLNVESQYKLNLIYFMGKKTNMLIHYTKEYL